MKKIVIPNMGQDSSVKGSLRSFIIIKMIRKGAQSPYDIFKEIKKQNKNEDPESIERSVLREFRNLQLEDKQSQKKIACEYSREVSGNTRYYHNLTDAGIDWHIEKFGLSSEDFWYTAINLFKKNYRFRFAYKNERSKRIRYANLDNKSRLEKWSFEKLYDEYKKRHDISERVFNPFGTLKTLNSIRNYLHEYFDYNENYFPVRFDYDQWRELLPILDAYVHNDPNKIEKVWKQVESGELDQVYRDISKEELVSRLKSDNILCTYANNGRNENKITIFGVLLYLVLIEIYSHYNKNQDEVFANIQEFLPLIFRKPIWSDLTKLKQSKELLEILVFPLMGGFEEIFEESFTYSYLEQLHRLYYYEQRIHYKIKQLFESGNRILDRHSKENNTDTELIKYLEDTAPLPKSLMKYEKTYSKFKELYFIFRHKRSDNSNIFDYNNNNKKLVREPISEFITFHFYTYLKPQIEERDWKKFLEEHGSVRKFWNEWQEMIPQIN